MDMKGLHDFADPMCEALETLVARGEAADRTDPTAWERGIAAIAPDDLAVLAYTAATTGVPRGVMLSHANLVANALQFRSWLPGLEEARERVMAALEAASRDEAVSDIGRARLTTARALVAAVVAEIGLAPEVIVDVHAEEVNS
jgi:acyl-CoA synthetase (AMP-forming)/AMP-acid ligase II